MTSCKVKYQLVNDGMMKRSLLILFFIVCCFLAQITEFCDAVAVITGPFSQQNLTIARSDLAGAANNKKIMFGGGYNQTTPISFATLDEYDVTSQSWTSSNLTVPRAYLAGVGLNNIIMFAGTMLSIFIHFFI